jgi:zinc ribbon protein
VPAPYCIQCGAELAADHRYCPQCGAERWTPPEEPRSLRPPPGAGTQPFHPPAPKPAAVPRMRWLPYLFAAGAVFWLIELAQFAAVAAAPAGRDQLHQALVSAGVTQNAWTVVVVEGAIVVGFEVAAVALHATAYFGLRRMRAWGWVAAVIVAAAWCLVLAGIPVMVVLLQRRTRQAYGIS